MKRCIALLTLALLFNAAVSRAEEKVYYTNNEDRYYHTDADCDRPVETEWFDYIPIEYYERECYRKMPVSEAAALEFRKLACPICVNVFEPVYLGDHAPEWNYEAAPWEINGMEPEDEQYFFKNRPEGYTEEIIATEKAFEAYYEEIYNRETETIERKHVYPAAYAGKYRNNTGSCSYRIVNPDAETIATFKKMFGGGAWIVPAKYGYDEIYNTRERIFREMMDWCAAHPELDARMVSATGPNYENYAVIGINGADWKQVAAAFEETAPIYIHFKYEEALAALACDAF